MAYKKVRWMRYGSRQNIIEIKIKDETERTIDVFKCNNNEALKQIIRVIHYKYGYDFSWHPSKDKRQTYKE